MVKKMKDLVKKALREDYAWNDITSLALVPPGLSARARIIARQGGVITGLALADQVFRTFDRRVSFRTKIKDGQAVKPGRIVAEISGPAQAILAAERTALNFLQRLSGIASLTAHLVRQAKPYGVKILDTRKTTPGWRALEKYAVKMGGGQNHRFDLAESVLIKDNHLRLAGGVRPALDRIKRLLDSSRGPGLKMLKDLLDFSRIEIEVENFSQLKAALPYKVGIIMLDNFQLAGLRKAIGLIRRTSPKTRIEISGIKLKDLGRIARLRPDRISLGALTSAAPPLDLSLEMA